MKMKDLKPGMTVAKRPDSWNPYGAPDRLVVLSTEYSDGGKRAYRRTSDAQDIVFSVTADDDGSKHRVKTSVWIPGYDTKAKVLVFNVTQRKTEWLTPGQVEGPFAQVRDERADTRLRQQEADRAAKARREEENRRMEALVEGLDKVGVKVDPGKTLYSTHVKMTLTDAEALLARLTEEG